MINGQNVRRRGWVLMGIGIFLVGLMSYIGVAIFPALTNPGQSVASGPRFTGTADQAALIQNLLKLLIGFGVLSCVTGLWQIVTGRSSRRLTIALFLLAAMFIVYTWMTQGTAGR